MTNAFKSIVSFVDLGIHESFEGVCFGFAFLKAWQHATIDKKMSYSLQLVNIQATQFVIFFCINMAKKCEECKVEWTKTCLDAQVCGH